jgi:DNA-3-methyladenine glycosylase
MNFQSTANEVDESFFARDVDVVACDLIGRRLRVTCGGRETHSIIVETEAYGDASDLASHTAFRPGGKAAIMADRAGLVYVYSAYGMYPCFNLVTGRVGEASAVLLRGVWRDGDPKPVLGPGRTTRLLGITEADHGAGVPGTRFGISFHREEFGIETTRRIGIRRAIETEWRFVATFEN